MQTAISPVALISGIGLLVLSMTNRFSQTANRARALADYAKRARPEETEDVNIQLRILFRRTRILMLAINFSLASVFAVGLLIISLFFIYVAGVNLQRVIVFFFVAALLCLATSLLLFIQDMALSLRALRRELKDIL